MRHCWHSWRFFVVIATFCFSTRMSTRWWCRIVWTSAALLYVWLYTCVWYAGKQDDRVCWSSAWTHVCASCSQERSVYATTGNVYVVMCTCSMTFISPLESYEGYELPISPLFVISLFSRSCSEINNVFCNLF